jgi:hypothetical protein
LRSSYRAIVRGIRRVYREDCPGEAGEEGEGEVDAGGVSEGKGEAQKGRGGGDGADGGVGDGASSEEDEVTAAGTAALVAVVAPGECKKELAARRETLVRSQQSSDKGAQGKGAGVWESDADVVVGGVILG